MFANLNNNWFCPNNRTGSAPGRRSDVFFRGTKVDRILWKFKTEFCPFAAHLLCIREDNSLSLGFLCDLSFQCSHTATSFSEYITYYCQPDHFRVMWTCEHGSKMIPQILIAWLGDYGISIRTSLLQKKWILIKTKKRTNNLPRQTRKKGKKELIEKH